MVYTIEEINQKIKEAEKAYTEQKYDHAVTVLNNIIVSNPNASIAYRKLGAILMRTDTPQQALPYLNKAVELAPKDPESWKTLGYYWKNMKLWKEAKEAFSCTLQYLPSDLQVTYELIQIDKELGNLQSALTMVKNLLQTDSNNAILLYEYASILKMVGKEEDAFSIYRQLVESGKPGIPIKAIEEWYYLMIQYRFIKEAKEILHTIVKNNPKNLLLRNLYGTSCMENREMSEALKVFEKSYKLNPDDITTIYILAEINKRMGHMDKSTIYLNKVLEKDSLHIEALRTLGEKHHFICDDELFRKINFALVHMAEFSLEKQITMHYLSGKAYDDIGDYATAFEHYKLGGALQAKGKVEKLLETFQHQFTRAQKFMTKEFFKKKSKGYRSNKPVFIIGMPRSGTTLMEQVLSEMEGVFGAGELPYVNDILNGMQVGDTTLDFGRRKSYFSQNNTPTNAERGKILLELMESHAPDTATRIIDKEPGNFVWLGYLYEILPDAKFIHTRRHPVETCLSAYRIRFASGQYWSCDLKTMGRWYRMYSELMEYWHSVLPEGTILDVRYEDMVNNLEEESKRIAKHIGAPWCQECLEFYNSQKPVATASALQVRRPLYKTSMNRWKKYESYLKPLLDEIGDLVEAYETELKETSK